MAAKTAFTYVLIPCSNEKELEECSVSIEEGGEDSAVPAFFGKQASVKLTLLIRPTENRVPGLYAYSSSSQTPNIRATRLGMACGLLSLRFHGDVLLFRHFHTSLTSADIHAAACVSPDLRPSVQAAMGNPDPIVHTWLSLAAQQNYHDAAALEEFAKVMTAKEDDVDESDDGSDDDDDDKNEDESKEEEDENETVETHNFIAKQPLCLHCRGPSNVLCEGCQGVYFCAPPRTCRTNCWSHDCVCDTWKVYADRREALKNFPSFDGDWYLQLMTRENELSEEPCRRFLEDTLGLKGNEASWWRTETDGWAGGQSESAQLVDPTVRRSYEEGFAPVTDFPPQRRPISASFPVNDIGLLELSSWSDYYRLRDIPLSSPVALLLTFPLTIYYALATYGHVPITVARMLKRPLRVHLVGVEKELNFLDIFQEVGYLLPDDLEVELVFIVREDMLPPKARKSLEEMRLTTNLFIRVVSGTYGDELDPNFDCGSGAPDMIVGLNAGLFAYESWRSVIEYLHHHEGVVGVFTDYNEHSGMNCATLGGSAVLHVNPFRQPRAMPVYSMNLPQFSNGFIYVYNEQELE